MKLNVSSIQKSILPAIGILVFLLAGCFMTQVTGTWKKQDYTGDKFTSILVVGVAKDMNNKNLWESVIADKLRQNGVKQVVTSSAAFPGNNQLNKKDIIKYVDENKLEGVIVTRLVNVKRENVYFPSPDEEYRDRYGYYNSFDSYYRHSFESLSYDYPSPGTTYDVTTVQLETTLFVSHSRELIWSMASDTYDPISINKLAKEVSRRIIKRLKQDQLI